jgi:hypothetical protein
VHTPQHACDHSDAMYSSNDAGPCSMSPMHIQTTYYSASNPAPHPGYMPLRASHHFSSIEVEYQPSLQQRRGCLPRECALPLLFVLIWGGIVALLVMLDDM